MSKGNFLAGNCQHYVFNTGRKCGVLTSQTCPGCGKYMCATHLLNTANVLNSLSDTDNFPQSGNLCNECLFPQITALEPIG